MRFTTTSTALAFVSLAVLAAATPAPWSTEGGAPSPTPTTITVTAPGPTGTPSPGTCSSGPVQCCQSTTKANSEKGLGILGLLNIVLTDLNVLLGLTCTPINVIGVGSGNACEANTVCCQNNNVGGLISIGCLPVFI